MTEFCQFTAWVSCRLPKFEIEMERRTALRRAELEAYSMESTFCIFRPAQSQAKNPWCKAFPMSGPFVGCTRRPSTLYKSSMTLSRSTIPHPPTLRFSSRNTWTSFMLKWSKLCAHSNRLLRSEAHSVSLKREAKPPNLMQFTGACAAHRILPCVIPAKNSSHRPRSNLHR